MNPFIQKYISSIKELCKLHDVEKLYLFGSALSENFSKDSDVDFLISLKKNLSPSEYTENYFSLHYKLRELMNKEIDLLVEKNLTNPFLMSSIDSTKELIYEA